jgi:hypothetical protein
MPCLHQNRFHCWHTTPRQYPKMILFQCCRCGKRKRGMKPLMTTGGQTTSQGPIVYTKDHLTEVSHESSSLLPS